MPPSADIRILRQSPDVDVSDLQAFLEQHGDRVQLQEFVPGPQASVDLFLPPTLEIHFSLEAAQPYIAGFLGWAGGYLTWATGKVILDKVREKTVDVALEELIRRFGERVAAVFNAARRKDTTFVRGTTTIHVPPLKLTFALPNPRVEKQGELALVFPADLTDDDLRQAFESAGKVFKAALRHEERRARFESRAVSLFRAGNTAAGMAMMSDERAHVWRRWSQTYAYRPGDGAWVDAWVLADQHMREERIDGFKEMLAASPRSSARAKALRRLVANMERAIRKARAQ